MFNTMEVGMMYLIAVPFVAFAVLTILTLASLSSRGDRRSTRRSRSSDAKERDCFASLAMTKGKEEGITIIKPIKGDISRFMHAIQSMFEQDYENYEIIFSVTERENQAKLKEMAARYPQVKTTIIYGDIDHAIQNPKVATIMPAYNLARYDIIVLSDADVIVPRDYLASINAQMADAKERGIGLISHRIRFVPNQSWLSRIYGVHLNTFIFGSHRMVSRFFKGAFPIGKSVVFRRSEFKRITSMQELGGYLAEDYMMGKLYAAAGLKTLISPVTIRSMLPVCTFKFVITRMMRWGIMRAKSSRKAYAGELCLNPLLMYLLLLPTTLWMPGLFVPLTTIFVAAYFVKLVSGEIVRAHLGCGARPKVFATLASDVFHAGTWLAGLVTSAIEWKGAKIYVGRNTRIVSYPAWRAFMKSVMLVLSVIVTGPFFFAIRTAVSIMMRPRIIDFLERSDLYDAQKDKLAISTLHGSLTNLAFIADINGSKYVVKNFWRFGDFTLFFDRLFGPKRDRSSLGNSQERFWGEIEGNYMLSKAGWRVPELHAYDARARIICMEFVDGKALDKLDDYAVLVREFEKFGADLAKLHESGTYLGDNYASHRFYLREADSACQLDLENVTKNGDPAWDLSLFLFYLQYLYTNSLRRQLRQAFIRGYRGFSMRMKRCIDVYHEQLAPYGWLAKVATHYR